MLLKINSTTLHHMRSGLLSNQLMKLIGQIRRERLIVLQRETGLSYADINFKLGRSRRDGTLSQIANKAPNSRTGKPRQMGDEQARELETAFDKPEGWFDRDPDFDDLLNQHTLLIAAEKTGVYDTWPFQSVSRERFMRLPEEEKRRIEALIEGQVIYIESRLHEHQTGKAAA